MYDPRVLGIKISAGAGSAGALAHTGALGIGWMLVAGFTLVMAGLALRQLLPRQRA